MALRTSGSASSTAAAATVLEVTFSVDTASCQKGSARRRASSSSASGGHGICSGTYSTCVFRKNWPSRCRCSADPTARVSDSIFAGTTDMLQLSPSFHPIPGQQRGHSEEDLPQPLGQRQRQSELAVDAKQCPESHQTRLLHAKPRRHQEGETTHGH